MKEKNRSRLKNSSFKSTIPSSFRYIYLNARMKSFSKSLIISFLFACFVNTNAKSQVYIIPEIGMNLSEFSFTSDDYKNTTNVGFQVGALARLGKNAYLNAGLFYSQYSNQLSFTDSLSNISSDNINIEGILLPLGFGFNIVNLDIFKIRLLAGVNFAFPLSVDENIFAIEKSDFNTSSIGFAAGFGLDIFRFVFDANFSFGMNDMLTINDTNASLNLYTLSIGYLIGGNTY